jgi:hypothetical protein
MNSIVNPNSAAIFSWKITSEITILVPVFVGEPFCCVATGGLFFGDTGP